MRIQELECCTGLDRATIRFYEKENLIHPQRTENGYRSYSSEDAQELMKIKLLRQLGMPVEQIRMMKQGRGDLASALENQVHVLESQMESKHRSALVCREMRDANVTYENMDAVLYLTRLSQIPDALPSGTPPKAFREPITGNTHPVRRYVARLLDVNLLAVAVQFILLFLMRLRPVPTTGIIDIIMSIGFWILSMPVNALFLHLWGTTPGKWIMGIRVKDFTGKKLSYIDALFREWCVFGMGLGWQLPIYCLYRQYKSFMTYVQTGETDWDEGTEIQFAEWKGKGKAKFAAAVVLILGMSGLIATDAYLPIYRQDQLTVAQFAKNYNFYLAQYGGNVHPGEKLKPDGSYDQDLVIPLYDYGITYEGNMPWVFETEEGLIRRISGQITGSVDFSGSCSWLIPCKAAAFTAILSRDGVTYGDLLDLTGIWQEIPSVPEGELNYDGLRISWYTEMQNSYCESGYYYILDEAQPASITVNFEIIYN